jgi:hypothetical protein
MHCGALQLQVCAGYKPLEDEVQEALQDSNVDSETKNAIFTAFSVQGQRQRQQQQQQQFPSESAGPWLPLIISQMNGRLDAIDTKLDTKFSSVDTKFSSVDTKISSVERLLGRQQILLWVGVAISGSMWAKELLPLFTKLLP